MSCARTLPSQENDLFFFYYCYLNFGLPNIGLDDHYIVLL